MRDTVTGSGHWEFSGNMYRLLIIAGLLILLYVLARRAFRELLGPKRGGGPIEAKDQLVLDPVCRTYVARENALAESIGGQTYYFCSSDCARAFREQLTG